jgi:hypothetical protein
LPTVFIGSSTEQLPTARALADSIRPFSRATVWNEAPFELNESIFGGLLKEVERTDFAVFVFEPDDVTQIRNVAARTIRDNVLFEFGLFKGRTFWVSAREGDGHHLPSDLVGITHLTFTPPAVADPNSLVVALTASASRLRDVIEKQGRRNDHAVEELDSVRALCVASIEYDQPQFADDIEQIRRVFPPGSITSAHGVNGDQLYGYFGETWDIVHLAMYVDPKSGDLIVPDRRSSGAATKEVIRVEGVEKMIAMSRARLVLVVTCDSLVLAARLARQTNTIAGHQPIDVRNALRWSRVFYPALAAGCPLSEAFNRAQTLADPGLVLISKRDFRLTLTTVDSGQQVARV